MSYFVIAAIVIIGYLLGSINSSLIVGKFYGVDVRQHGSGNAGATNTLRTLGKKAAIFTTIGDFLKGIIACLAGSLLANLVGISGFTNSVGLMLCGACCVIGHNWPVFFGFKGGKGVLTSFAVLIMMAPFPALIAFTFFIIVVLITRYISLGSMLSAAFLVIIGFFFGDKLGVENPVVYASFTAVLAAILIFRHRGNIKRIINGTESKFSLKHK